MAIAVVQAVAKNTTTSSITAPTAGNQLYVCINSFNGTTASITSVKLGTTSLTLAQSMHQAGDGDTASWVYYLPSCPASQTSVIVTGSGLQVDSSNGGVDIIEGKQDGTGSRTVAYNSVYEFTTDNPSPTLTVTANKVDELIFIYNSTSGKWRFQGILKGYS